MQSVKPKECFYLKRMFAGLLLKVVKAKNARRIHRPQSRNIRNSSKIGQDITPIFFENSCLLSSFLGRSFFHNLDFINIFRKGHK